MRKLSLLVVLVLLSLLPSGNARAAACESMATGDWSAAGTWQNCDGHSPTLNDTADIVAGHTVTVNVDASAGNSPGDETTYNIQVHGTLAWGDADSNSLQAYSSIKVFSGGALNMGTVADPIACDVVATLEFKNTGGPRYHLVVENGGVLNMHGCANYLSQDYLTAVVRARIASCDPDCDAGAITITLDATTNWVDRTDPFEPGSDPQVVIGGGGGPIDPTNTYKAEMAAVTAFPATNQITVVTTQDHQPGDIVFGVTRNVAVWSNDDDYQGAIWSTATGATHPFSLSWARLHHMGNATYAALDHDAATTAAGAIDYMVATNCAQDEDAGALGIQCFRMRVASLDSFTWNMGYKTVGRQGFGSTLGHCFSFGGTLRAPIVLANATCIDAYTGVNANTAGAPVNVSAGWFSCTGDGTDGAALHGNIGDITNSLFHQTTGGGGVVIHAAGYPTWWQQQRSISGNEFYNAFEATALLIGTGSVVLRANEFRNSEVGCVWFYPDNACECEVTDYFGYFMPIDATFLANSYDNCNYASVTGGSLENIYSGAVGFWAQGGQVRMYSEVFGASAANSVANLYFHEPTDFSYGVAGGLTFACNDCMLGAVADGPVGWTEPIWYGNGAANYVPTADWQARAFIGPNTFLGLQNIDTVANSTFTVGPGGCTVEYEGAIKIDNTLNLKVTPFAAHNYARIPLRRVYVQTGDTLTVTLQVRKTGAVDYNPRLVLMGPGFDPTIKYDEATGASGTWMPVSVTGTASAPGLVLVYLDVRGNLAPAGVDDWEPVMPPTLVIYADGLAVVKS